jgi:pyruvate dehydrogenase E2 component (dihydrolipoamide acetyltransferase)
MHAALQEAAHVTLTRYADADVLLSYARRLRATADLHGDVRIGINDLVLFATSRAVAKHPEANSWFSWDGITRFDDVHLGFAVDTGQALLVPVIRSANTLALAQLASQARVLIERARSGKTTSEEMSGGTFTVSNLGGLGIHWFTPVLNPPQTCILGVGAAHRSHPDVPAQVPLSLTFDHRALDGASAAKLLGSIATAIEHVDTLAA